MSEIMNEWKRRDYGTRSIKKLLQTHTGHYSALSSNNTYKGGSIHQSKRLEKLSSSINEGSEQQNHAPGPFREQNNYLAEDDLDDDELSRLYSFAT